MTKDLQDSPVCDVTILVALPTFLDTLKKVTKFSTNMLCTKICDFFISQNW